MRYFKKRIIARIHEEQDVKIKDLLNRKIIIGDQGLEYKYKNLSHLIRCAINVLYQKELEDEKPRTDTKED